MLLEPIFQVNGIHSTFSTIIFISLRRFLIKKKCNLQRNVEQNESTRRSQANTIPKLPSKPQKVLQQGSSKNPQQSCYWRKIPKGIYSQLNKFLSKGGQQTIKVFSQSCYNIYANMGGILFC